MRASEEATRRPIVVSSDRARWQVLPLGVTDVSSADARAAVRTSPLDVDTDEVGTGELGADPIVVERDLRLLRLQIVRVDHDVHPWCSHARRSGSGQSSARRRS